MSFIISENYWGDQIKNEIDWAYSTHGNEKYIPNFVRKIWRGAWMWMRGYFLKHGI
jgi:hypothetical protein